MLLVVIVTILLGYVLGFLTLRLFGRRIRADASLELSIAVMNNLLIGLPILDAMYGRNEEVTTEDFQTAMEKTKTKYLIVEEHLANGGFLVQAGCRQVSVVAGYTIFRYGD